MATPLPLGESLAAFAALLLLAFLLARSAFPGPRARRALLAAAALLAVAHAAWSLGEAAPHLARLGACTAAVALPFAAVLVPALLVAAVARALLARAVERAPEAHLVTRRAVVQAVTASIPLAACAAPLAGFVLGAEKTRVRRVVLPFEGLPPALHGLRILQLSDLHLGLGRTVDDLERLLDDVARSPLRPDLVVLTGDVADDVDLLRPALAAVAAVRPRLGVFASLGNHEYLRDIRRTRPAIERSGVPLLVGRGAVVRTGGATLYLAGADDPVVIHGDIGPWMQRTVDQALDGAPSDAFHVLLSHRPEGFDAAARAGVHLTLSGHTHGGQIGFNGRSAFEPIWGKYLWGSYARGASRLYTTSGFGDWYPLRLGCPTEAPIVELLPRA